MPVGTLVSYAEASRCAGDELCMRVHAMEPGLPISPPLVQGVSNPCIEVTGHAPVCLPGLHIIAGWHMFDKEAFAFLRKLKQLDFSRSGGCFDDWAEDGAARWVEAWGAIPSAGVLKVAQCNKLLGWYPAFAGRYTSAWGKEYGPCKDREMAKGGDYYGTKMWPVCRPAAMKAHDAAMGTGGSGREATPPFVMHTLYGDRVRVVTAVRNPVDRLETAFWVHSHYPKKYGASAAGLHAYVAEQTKAFDTCSATYGGRRCAFLFELLDQKNSDVFFHCDQIIRGLYEPFLRDWHAAFGRAGLAVLRVEDLLGAPAAARRTLLDFLGLPDVDLTSLPAPETTYAALHAQSLRGAKAEPMLPATRRLAEDFYRPFGAALAELLGDPSLAWPQGSTVVDAEALAGGR